ncbi:MAG TPA: DUF445 domain-containing protein [Polaromonas sp.]|nr:DUF445 domain-containing protein [Polaromonas sp.]
MPTRRGVGVSTEKQFVEQLDSARDAHQRLRLKLMQRIALGLLLGMAVIYVLALSQRHAHPALGFVVAFSEAAMIGAIADWFAVVALFRHPMGIPIWHTAIIPNSKDDIGRNLGEFVENHFITEEAISQRLRAVNPAGLLSTWLLAPNTASKLGHTMAKAFEKLLKSLDDAKISRILGEAASRQLSQLDVSATAGKVADLLVAESKHQDLLDGVLLGIADYLSDESNKPQIAAFLIGAFEIDNAILKKGLSAYVPRGMRSLNQFAVGVHGNVEHPLRKRFDALVKDFVLRLKADPDWYESIARYQQETLVSPQVEVLLNSIWGVIKLRLKADLTRDDPVIAAQLATLVRKVGEILAADADLREWLNQAIESGSVSLILQHRGEVGKFIEGQLAQWTKDEMSQRIELAIGRDLQFIRINGTLVGGLVGVIIYALTQLTGRAG